jgi:hypothetical protein
VRFSIDHSGFDRHADRVEDGFDNADDELRRVVNKGAFNVKAAWKAAWTGIGHLPHIASSISYDVTGGGGTWKAEIGPDKQRSQGPLGTIIENANGAARNHATHSGNRAGRAEEPRFERAVAEVAEDAAGG